jgi:hypothetical protein
MKINLSDQEKMPRRSISTFHIAENRCTVLPSSVALRA